MAKVKTAFFCQSCGTQSPKWLGKCPSCGEWNTFVEEQTGNETKEVWREEDSRIQKSKALSLDEISTRSEAAG